jgi:hypothetical protein
MLPPPLTGCANSAASVIIPELLPPDAFLIRYAANLDLGDSFVNITNTGANAAPLLGPGFGSSAGNLCANVSRRTSNDLLNTTLTGVIPASAIIKVVASLPDTNLASGGILAWGTTVHQAPRAGLLGVSETPFRSGTLTAAEPASIRGRCAAILGNGSGFGVCKSCRAGALGGSGQQ